MASAIVVGSSKGIGLSLVEQLLVSKNFDKVFACTRESSAELDGLASDHQGLVILKCDSSSEASIAEMAKQISANEVSAIDLAILALGTLHGDDFFPERKIEELNPESFQKVLSVNCVAVGVFAKHLKPFFKESLAPRFVAVSAKVGSIADNKMGGWYSYRVSKAALNMLVKNISIEFARLNREIACISIHPGTTETQLSAPFMMSAKKRYKVHSTSETAKNIMSVISKLQPEDNGQFFSWDGSRLPW